MMKAIHMKNNSFTSYLGSETGVAAVEMAFILPVMLLLYFGLVDLTSFISYNRKITSVASAVADLTGQNRTSVLKATVQDYFSAGNMIMDPLPKTDVSIRVFGFRSVSGTATQYWKVYNNYGPGCPAPSTSGMTDLMTAGNELVVAQACMRFTPFIATFLGQSILGATSYTVEQQVVLRPRSSLVLTCYPVTVSGTTYCS